MVAFGGANVNSHSPTTSAHRSPTLSGGALPLFRDDSVLRRTSCTKRVRSAGTALPAVSELVGASEETGGVFDPLGLATDEVSSS